MSLFISYARADLARVEQLRADIERVYGPVWLDRRLIGGEDWWDQILREIRDCDLFLLAVSPASCKSDACLAELGYALALGRPFLAVTVAATELHLAPVEVTRTQVVDGVDRTADGIVELVAALKKAPRKAPPPDDLPEPPPRPESYTEHYRRQLAVPEGRLGLAEQVQLVEALKFALGMRDHREEALELLRQLNDRADVIRSVSASIDTLLVEVMSSPTSVSPDPVAEPSRDDLQAKLSQLNRLRSQGALSEDEYEAALLKLSRDPE